MMDSRIICIAVALAVAASACGDESERAQADPSLPAMSSTPTPVATPETADAPVSIDLASIDDELRAHREASLLSAAGSGNADVLIASLNAEEDWYGTFYGQLIYADDQWFSCPVVDESDPLGCGGGITLVVPADAYPLEHNGESVGLTGTFDHETISFVPDP